ncbi:hypothetical protein [Botryobacter ruber]|uniref:hypothetical protein n=1 Tax=Botryobacter ruber TaxID=2171629 RepID=UPI001F0C8F2F|nr:hypothetical protein [Botryobacter ruber]
MQPLILKLFAVYVYLQALFCGCLPDRRNSGFVRLRQEYKVKVQRIGRLDSRITESSGLARASDSTFWTHADGGPLNELYLVNLTGELLQTVPLQVPNNDWEDLAQEGPDTLYIGDFGNNTNTRRNLQVFKVNPGTRAVLDTIRFSFGDQAAFPPPRKERHFDLEAFFHYNDTLHLFTKSRALKPVTRLYKLPASGGNYKLQPEEELRLQSAVTAADVSGAHDKFALLGYGRLYLFQLEPEQASVTFRDRRFCLPLGRTGQAEAVLFLSPEQLLISNEKGNLYLVTIHEKK